MKAISLVFLLAACGRMEYSPWQTNVPDLNSNQRNLDLIAKLDQTLPFTIALTSDPQGVPADLAHVVHRLNKLDIKFMVVTGDLTDFGLKQEYEWAYDALSESTHPFIVVPGNHDGLSKGKDIYSRMFGADNYAFTFGPYKFVMWNNNKWEWKKNIPDWSWLESVVDDNTIMMSHIAPITDIFEDEALAYWIDFNTRKRIKASIHGHRHLGDLWDVADIPYYIIPRVADGHYTLMTFKEDGTFELVSCERSLCERLL